ncbi:MAG TPA: DUF2254 domain-containing protein [Streptosporangiaceae bacterium]|nr:DUF2254 domain-containing protein [Streptosporangiaceae bacterium]
MYRLKHQARSSIWLIPSLGLLGGLGLAVLTIAIDRAHHYGLVSHAVTGTSADVQTILSTAATALVTLTSVVLSLTLVAVQLAMGQFSPRIVGALLNDRPSQAAIALFTGTFSYTMLVTREVNDKTGAVPGLSVLISYALILGSVLALVLFVHHAGQGIRVSGLIDLVGDRTREQLEARYPRRHADAPPPPDGREVLASLAPGNVVHVDYDRLVAIARQAGARLEFLVTMGDFVPGGAPLFRVSGTLSEKQCRQVLGCVLLGPERTHDDDPSYGIRKLADIAERSIASSPFEDPSTTVMALHRLHDCLRILAGRQIPPGQRCDADGQLRLTMRVLDWDGYVRLAFDEIRLAGAGSPQVARRLRAALEDLRTVVPPSRRAALDRQLDLLSAAVTRQYHDGRDRRAALTSDNEGIGSGPDVVMPDVQRNSASAGTR